MEIEKKITELREIVKKLPLISGVVMVEKFSVGLMDSEIMLTSEMKAKSILCLKMQMMAI